MRLYFMLLWHDGTSWQDITGDVAEASVEFELDEKVDKLIAKINGTKSFKYNQLVELYCDSAQLSYPPPSTKLLYKGYIEKVEIELKSGKRHAYPLTTIHCVDYTERLLQKIVTESYKNQTVGYIVKDLVSKYLPGEVTTNGVEDDGTIVKDIRFAYQPLSTALKQLKELPRSGPHSFYIDVGLDLKFFRRDKESPVIATIENSNTVDYKWYEDFTNVKNVVLLIGGKEYSVDVEQTTALNVTYSSKDYYYADSFVPNQSTLGKIELYLEKVGTPGNLTGKVVMDSGGNPTGAEVKQWSIEATQVSSAGWYVIMFESQYLQPNATYWIIINKVGDASNYYKIYGDVSGYMKSSIDGTTWSSITGSIAYRVYWSRTVLARAGTAPSNEERVHMIVSSLMSKDTARLLAQTQLANLLAPEKQIDATIDPVVGLRAGQWVNVQLDDVPEKGNYLLWKVHYIFGPFLDCHTLRIQAARSEPPKPFEEIVRKLKDSLYEERLKSLGIDETTILEVAQYAKDVAIATEWNKSKVIDWSGNGNNGTIYGAQWVPDKFGSALSFDGVDDYVTIPNTGSTIGIGDALTVTIWVKPFDQIAGTYTYHKDIVASQCYGGGGLWRISTASDYNTSEKLVLQIGWIPGVSTFWNPTEAIAKKNEWNHLVLLLDRTTGKAKFYRNGQFVAETTRTVGSRPTTNLVNIARDCAGFFNGLIDEVCIWNRALSSDEISQLYNNGQGMVIDPTSSLGSGLVLYLRFEGHSLNIRSPTVKPKYDYSRGSKYDCRIGLCSYG